MPLLSIHFILFSPLSIDMNFEAAMRVSNLKILEIYDFMITHCRVHNVSLRRSRINVDKTFSWKSNKIL